MILCLSSPNRWAVRLVKIYGAAAAFVAAFGQIYLRFSHGVFSRYMCFAFMIPFVFGVCFWSIFAYTKLMPERNPALESLMHAATVTLTIGAIERGIVYIYGTTNILLDVFFYAAGILYAAAALVFFFTLWKRHLRK